MAHDPDPPAAPVATDPDLAAGAGAAISISFTAARDRPYVERMVRETARGITWAGRLYLLALLLISVLCFISGDGRAVLAGLLSLSLRGLSWQQMDFPARRILREIPPYTFDPYEFVITDSALTITSAVASTRTTWPTFTRAQERPYAFILTEHGQRYRDIPQSPLTSEQDEQLRHFLISSGLLLRPEDYR